MERVDKQRFISFSLDNRRSALKEMGECINTMDLRVKKTKRAIRSAFYSLIREKPLEKITVREIAERAEINKTTFYAHYETVYDLVDQLEREAVEEILKEISTAQNLMVNPRAFVLEMYTVMTHYAEDFKMIPTAAMGQFNTYLQTAVLEKVQEDGIDSVRYEWLGAVLIFLLNGLVGLYNTSPELAAAQLSTIADFVEAGVRVLPQS